ncbi:hypothetical protein KAW18_11575 [candidate division WOR-3 bacterium]|nr:hypothetical protein [candidate division WOR-3 bacterium]
MDEYEVYRKAIEEWGEDGAISAFHEEVGELMTAMSHFRRGRIPIEEVIEEIVDVKIAIEMMRVLFDKSPDFDVSSDIYVKKFWKIEDTLHIKHSSLVCVR